MVNDDAKEQGAAGGGQQVNAVSVKLPAFWTSNPDGWFFQAEAQFGLRGITNDQTKYWHLVAALDSETSIRAASFLQRPPPNDQYQGLRRFLLDTYGLSTEERAQRLFSIRDLGDRRPSELADTILQLNGEHQEHFCLRHIFLQALPITVRQVLAASPIKGLRDLGLEADRILSTCESVNTMVEETTSVDAVNSSKKPVRNLCFYHKNFGTKARRCQAPCDWVPRSQYKPQGNAQAGSR